mgnify:CR=1 FL=1
MREAVPDAAMVGFFRDEGPEVGGTFAEALGLAAVQAEGWLDRVPWPLAEVWHVLRGPELPEPSSLPMIPLRTYLLDAHDADRPGGTGKRADTAWAATAVRDGIRLFVAGGLHPGNVASLVLDIRPYGVDASSGLAVDGSPRRKDLAKVRAFIEQVRLADRSRPKRS